jgi:hypothetical protein
VTAPTQPPARAIVPELGPALGRLCDRPGHQEDGRWVRLDDLRLDLVTRVFELAGAAREFAAGDDRAAALASLNRAALLGAWEETVAEAAGRLAAAIEARLLAAADEARLPERRRRELPLNEADRRAVAARLGAGSLPFLHSLDALEQTVHVAMAPGERGSAVLCEWQDALLAAARRLESAWLGLETAARREQDIWLGEIERVRSWRRPTAPLWALTAAVLAIATYLGLVLGGYLPVPDLLRGLAEAWWSRL